MPEGIYHLEPRKVQLKWGQVLGMTFKYNMQKVYEVKVDLVDVKKIVTYFIVFVLNTTTNISFILVFLGKVVFVKANAKFHCKKTQKSNPSSAGQARQRKITKHRIDPRTT